MKKKMRQMGFIAALLCVCVFGTACSSNNGEQTYAWPLATCSSGR